VSPPTRSAPSTWRETGRAALPALLDLGVVIHQDAAEIEWLLDLVERERPGWLLSALEHARAERTMRPPTDRTYAATIAEMRPRWEPLVAAWREGVIAAVEGFEPLAIADPEVLDLRALVDEGGFIRIAGPEPWPMLWRRAVDEWAAMQLDHCATAAELADNFGDPSKAPTPAEFLAEYLETLTPVLLAGPGAAKLVRS
jgi:hypothetical protein